MPHSIEICTHQKSNFTIFDNWHLHQEAYTVYVVRIWLVFFALCNSCWILLQMTVQTDLCCVIWNPFKDKQSVPMGKGGLLHSYCIAAKQKWCAKFFICPSSTKVASAVTVHAIYGCVCQANINVTLCFGEWSPYSIFLTVRRKHPSSLWEGVTLCSCHMGLVVEMLMTWEGLCQDTEWHSFSFYTYI